MHLYWYGMAQTLATKPHTYMYIEEHTTYTAYTHRLTADCTNLKVALVQRTYMWIPHTHTPPTVHMGEFPVMLYVHKCRSQVPEFSGVSF